MSPQRIQLRRTKGWKKPDGAVVVARPSRWGNPFHVDRYGQQGAVDAFRRYLKARRLRLFGWVDWIGYPSDAEIRYELRGHDLCCWCPPSEPCHVDALLEIANGAAS